MDGVEKGVSQQLERCRDSNIRPICICRGKVVLEPVEEKVDKGDHRTFVKRMLNDRNLNCKSNFGLVDGKWLERRVCSSQLWCSTALEGQLDIDDCKTIGDKNWLAILADQI